MSLHSQRPDEESGSAAKLPIEGDLTFVYRLSGLLAGLLLVASLVGLATGPSGLYDAYPAALAGLLGQDMVTLALGVPLLVGAMWLTHRDSVGGLLLWAGALFYFAYSYYFFLVGGFNALFPVYVAIEGTAAYALLALLFRIDADALNAGVAGLAPVRRTAMFFIVTASLFALMWGGLSVSSVIAGEPLDPVAHLVIAIDCAILLPLLVFGGLKLWRREPWGYVLGGVLLTKATATGLTLAFTSTLALWWADSTDPFQVFLALLFGSMALIGLLLLIPYLRVARDRSRPATLGNFAPMATTGVARPEPPR